MAATTDDATRAWLLAQANGLLDFARASRAERGGFAWLDSAGRPDLSHDRELWITCRMTHCFALGHLLGRSGDRELAAHGISALRHDFADLSHDGWFAALNDAGATSTAKQAYALAFVILAASSATVAGVATAPDLLRQALTYWERYFLDRRWTMTVDEWNADHSWLSDYRGANANMHTVEALLAAADVTGESRWRELALASAERLIAAARANHWLLPEHFDVNWQPLLAYNADRSDDQFKPYGATLGHSLEWSRLLLQLQGALGPGAPSWLGPAAVALFDRATQLGWAVDGADGFVYTVDWEGQPVVRARMHWVIAEAIGAAASLQQVTGDPRYAQWYDRWWDYARRYVIDPAGSWHHELDPSNQPAATVWSGKPDVYHALQACLIPLVPVGPCLSVALAQRA